MASPFAFVVASSFLGDTAQGLADITWHDIDKAF
jgi:hypothetical protein